MWKGERRSLLLSSASLFLHDAAQTKRRRRQSQHGVCLAPLGLTLQCKRAGERGGERGWERVKGRHEEGG